MSEFEPGGDPAKDRALIAQYNRAYDAFCAKWFGSSSPFLSHLVALKRHLVQDVIPQVAKAPQMGKLQLQMLGIPSAEYESSEPFIAVGNYLGVVHAVFARRPIERK